MFLLIDPSRQAHPHDYTVVPGTYLNHFHAADWNKDKAVDVITEQCPRLDEAQMHGHLFLQRESSITGCSWGGARVSVWFRSIDQPLRLRFWDCLSRLETLTDYSIAGFRREMAPFFLLIILVYLTKISIGYDILSKIT